MSYIIRPWALRDIGDVMGLIQEAAIFHKALDQVKVTPKAALRWDGFGEHPRFGFLVAEVPPKQRSKDGQAIVGYQFHYFSYCTWDGRILFGEDLYVRPEFRGKGIGRSLLTKVAEVAVANGCSQFRFVSAKWNKPATALFEKLGAVDVTKRDCWNVWHFEGQAVQELATRLTQ